MTGDEVRWMRDDLGWTARKFAVLLGVNASTVVRWERRRGAAIIVEPLQASLLIQLQKALQRDVALGCALTAATESGDTLRGLYVLLSAVFRSERREAPAVVVIFADSAATGANAVVPP